ncbi:hypothetical protein [Demequina sp. NBRC 110052]|uniref:hypothetical protein n=1 Tax=Demequina sp. NBRC 110052 TaxID=1570341 RepID=UPI001F3E7B53|nr:hypothetical protein [Demequina sp. NBRC 110052]
MSATSPGPGVAARSVTAAMGEVASVVNAAVAEGRLSPISLTATMRASYEVPGVNAKSAAVVAPSVTT